MGIKITDMDPIDQLKKDDLFEVARPAANGTTNSSYQASAQQMGAYFKNLNNGGFKGKMTKDLTEVTYADVGTWWWQGTAPISGMPSQGILEVLCTIAPEDVVSTEAPTITLRLTNHDSMFIKSKPGDITGSADTTATYPWGACKNKNGNIIFSGTSNSDMVEFPVSFAAAPKVLVTPVNSFDDRMYYMNVYDVTTQHFRVKRFEMSLSQTTTESESETVEEQSGGNPKKTTTESTTVTYNTFTPSTSYEYHWLATLDG